MNVTQQGLLLLLRSAVTGESLSLPEGFDWEAARPYIGKHQIAPLIYEGAVNCGVDRAMPLMQRLSQVYCKNLVIHEGQMRTIEKIFAAFEAEKIEYMPVKGCNMKLRYPKPELRVMGDADILIKLEQYDRIRTLMAELGFREDEECDHELNWQTDVLKIELHKRLIPSYNRDYFSYFGDGWQLAKKQAGSRWLMTPEDEYIYLFTHFAKHYRDGGIGLRHVLDLWVFDRSTPQLDEAYLERELNKLQLWDFHRNIRRLIEVWFCGEQTDERSEFISEFIFGSGSWGTQENKDVAMGARDARNTGSVEKGKRRFLQRSLFPTVAAMKRRYPILQKVIVLLPVFWIVRWVETLLLHRDRLSERRNKLQKRSIDQIETYQQAMNYVGLDFHFKE